jgi:tricorn protease
LAVNGLPVEVSRSPFAALDNTAGRVVSLTISENKELGDDDDRDVVVKPMSSDYNLRFRWWIEQNRKYVEEKTDGKVGYIYVTNTGRPGQNDLIRHLYGQINKPALIVDERWNGGGQIPTRFIELLNRPVTNYWATRDGHDMTWPPDSHQGPKCMLINGMSGSGGDMFPALFKQNKLGKLIGRRTWGGLVGISGNPGLIDGSGVTAPTFAYYENDGTWGIEGHGVDPDIDVIDDPALMLDGGDPQLDAAIKHIQGELKKNPYKPVKRPAYPDRKGFGLEEADK